MYNSINIVIGGTEKKLIGTFQNMVDIETEMQKSIFKMVTPLITGEGSIDLTVKQMVSIIYLGLRGLPNNTLERESIQNEIMANGAIVYLDSCAAFLLSCISGCKKKAEVSGNQEPQEISPKE